MQVRTKVRYYVAVQWTKELRWSEFPNWLSVAMNLPMKVKGGIFRAGDNIYVECSDGVRVLMPGDYLIRHASGKLMTCSERDFNDCYEVGNWSTGY